MIRIRPYKDSDEETILSWCRDETTYRRWTAGVLGTFPITHEQFSETGRLMRFTALDEKAVVGFFTLRNPSDTLDELRFGFVIVDPARRGAGIGQKMLRLGLRYAFEIYRAHRVTIGVFEENTPARRCYRAVGFTETGRIESYIYRGAQYRVLEMESTEQEGSRL